METIMEYFCKEIEKAGNGCTRLAVLTALFGFLEKDINLKFDKNSFDIIVKCLIENVFNEKESDPQPFSLMEDSKDKESDLDCPDKDNECNAEMKVERNVRDLQIIAALKCVNKLIAKGQRFKFEPSLQKSLLTTLHRFCDSEKNRCDFVNFKFCQNFTKCIQKYISTINCEIRVKENVKKTRYEEISIQNLKKYLDFYEPDIAKFTDKIVQPFAKGNENSNSDDKKIKVLCLDILKDAEQKEDVIEVMVAQQVGLRKYSSQIISRQNDDSSKEKGSTGSQLSPKSSENDSGGSNSSNSSSKGSSKRLSSSPSDYFLVRKVLNGNLFWVNKGDKSVQKVTSIHSLLNSQIGSLQRSTKCKVGDTVAAIIKCDDLQTESSKSHSLHHVGEKTLTRATVLQVSGSEVTVFALDIGGVYRVSSKSVLELPDDLKLSQIPPQAELACIQGLSPAPCDFRMVEMALMALSRLCRMSALCLAYLELNPLCAIASLIMCGNSHVSLQALRLGSTITRTIYVGQSRGWSSLMLAALELINREARGHLHHPSSPRESIDGTPKNRPSNNTPLEKADCQLIMEALRLVANCLHKNSELKDLFYKQNGLESVLLCQNLMQKRSAEYGILKVLFNFLYSGETRSSRSNLGRTGFGRADIDQSPDKEGEDASDDSGADDSFDAWMESDEEEDCNDLDSDQDEDISNSSSTGPRYFVKGSKVENASNPRYEMLLDLDMSTQTLALIVCGMFNSGHEGKICIGVNQDGQVQGLSLTSDQRDEIRLGIDDLTVKLSPCILHFQLETSFIPVIEMDETADTCCDNNNYPVTSTPTTTTSPSNALNGSTSNTGTTQLCDAIEKTQACIIEIVCKPIPGLIYVTKGGKCYYRTGRKTMLVQEQDIRHLIVLDCEEKYSEEIISLQRRLNQLLTLDQEEPSLDTENSH